MFLTPTKSKTDSLVKSKDKEKANHFPKLAENRSRSSFNGINRQKEAEKNEMQVYESHEDDDRSGDIFTSILGDFFAISCRAIQMNSNVSSIIHEADYQGYKS